MSPGRELTQKYCRPPGRTYSPQRHVSLRPASKGRPRAPPRLVSTPWSPQGMGTLHREDRARRVMGAERPLCSLDAPTVPGGRLPPPLKSKTHAQTQKVPARRRTARPALGFLSRSFLRLGSCGPGPKGSGRGRPGRGRREARAHTHRGRPQGLPGPAAPQSRARNRGSPPSAGTAVPGRSALQLRPGAILTEKEAETGRGVRRGSGFRSRKRQVSNRPPPRVQPGASQPGAYPVTAHWAPGRPGEPQGERSTDSLCPTLVLRREGHYTALTLVKPRPWTDAAVRATAHTRSHSCSQTRAHTRVLTHALTHVCSHVSRGTLGLQAQFPYHDSRTMTGSLSPRA